MVWKRFLDDWPFVRGIQLVPDKGCVIQNFGVFLIVNLKHRRTNSRGAGDLRRHGVHVTTVMFHKFIPSTRHQIKFWWSRISILSFQRYHQDVTNGRNRYTLTMNAKCPSYTECRITDTYRTINTTGEERYIQFVFTGNKILSVEHVDIIFVTNSR